MTRSRWLPMMVGALAIVTFALRSGLGAQVPDQGIKVHGHWLIEVRNADGTLELQREFDNALLDGGKATLLSLLMAQKTIDSWAIQVSSDTGPCANSQGSAVNCLIEEPTGPHEGPSVFRNLTKTTGHGNPTLILQGSFVAANGGAISIVATLTNFSTGGVSLFTGTSLESPIPVQATQTVSITVTISVS